LRAWMADRLPDTALGYPFCGGDPTTLAKGLGGNWADSDVRRLVVWPIEKRVPGAAFEVYGIPKDVEGEPARGTGQMSISLLGRVANRTDMRPKRGTTI
jgi:hypothetical protein